MRSFKQFLSNEGMWGQIPVQGKKPSDGRGGYSMSNNTGATSQGPAAPVGDPTGPKMMRKKMKKI